MKKLFVLMMALVLCFSLVACTVNVNTDKKDDNKTTDSSSDTSADSESVSESSDDTDEIPAIDMDEHLSMVEDLCMELMDYEGNYYEGICGFCEDVCDEGYFICDACLETEICQFCGEELAEGEIVSCIDCIYEISAGLDSVDTEIEDTETDEMDYHYNKVENIMYEYGGEEIPEGVCLCCEEDNDNDSDGLLFCTECIESDVCLICESVMDTFECILCNDCLVDLEAALVD